MNSVIFTMAIGYLLQKAASWSAGEDVGTAQQEFATELSSVSYFKGHPGTASAIEKVANPTIAVVLKALQDTPDLKTVITALASSNVTAAQAALMALATQAAPQLAAVAAAFGAAS